MVSKLLKAGEIMRKIFTLILILFLSGCATFKSQPMPVLNRPTLAFVGVPKDSVLNIDGMYICALHTYDGVKKVLSVECGQHKIIIQNKQGDVIYAETISVGNNLKVISL